MSSPLTDPRVSAWVSASAGTGKTKLLIDRLAHLLLAGASPSSLLCLTYTRAAAGEMVERLHAILTRWQQASDDGLVQLLTNLLGRNPHIKELERAKTLAQLCRNEPVVIQTLHSFAQTVIKRAGGTRRLIEGHELATLWRQTVQQTFTTTHQNPSWAALAKQTTWFRLEELLWQIYQNRYKWMRIQAYYGTLEAEHDALGGLIPPPPIPPFFDEQWDTWHDHPFFDSFGDKLPWKEWANQSHIQNLFLTLKGEPRKRVPPHSCMADWQQSIADFRRHALHEKWLLTNQALKDIALPIMEAMQRNKELHHVWDYSDLLEQAMILLESDAPTLERLHGQLHHILVDEAQDTSPEQWAIIDLLVRTFLDEEGRTLFVVGDLKQSIYSFQGADPDLFVALEQSFASHFQGRPWKRATLDASWRSTAPVLQLVDAVFHLHGQGVRLDDTHTPHRLTRHHAPGRVTLWPLVSLASQDKPTPWQTPPLSQPATEPLARDIAKRIGALLGSGEVLPSTGAPIKPSDIWVLLTRRGPLMSEIEKALVDAGIPTSGVDRIDVWNHLLVQDAMALARFVLLPRDDWSLACVLKSPFFKAPVSEEELYTLCHNRSETLWHQVQKAMPDHALQLKKWMELWAEGVPPSMWFTALFHDNKEGIHTAFGHTADDVMAAFLKEVYHFEQHHAPSLQAFVAEDRQDCVKRHVMVDQGVHLTTVHSAKGLQAPIIILADATDSPRPQQDDFVWSYNPPLMALRPTREHTDLSELYDQHTHGVTSENRRLFYVALTRAADQLYATGLKREAKNSTWYDLMSEALLVLGCTDTLSHGVFEKGVPWRRDEALGAAQPTFKQPIALPRFEREGKVDKSNEAERGILLHKWMEIMRPHTNAHVFLQRHDPKGLLTLEQLEACQQWLGDPKWAWMFGGQAEVDIIDQYGKLRRIDRLVVGEKDIWVIDFKTGHINEPAMAAYRKQMQGYRRPLQAIYPDHAVHCRIVLVEGNKPEFWDV